VTAQGYGQIAQRAPLTLSQDILNVRVEQLYFDDRSLIEQFGYFWPDGELPQEPLDEVGRDIPGSVYDDCNAKPIALINALNERYGDPSEIQHVDRDLSLEADSSTQLEPARQAWNECMISAGYPGSNFLGPIADRGILTKARALQDYLCRQSSKVSYQYAAWLHARLLTWVDSNPQLVADSLTYWQKLASAGVDLESEG
jgi:hypothetical protein